MDMVGPRSPGRLVVRRAFVDDALFPARSAAARRPWRRGRGALDPQRELLRLDHEQDHEAATGATAGRLVHARAGLRPPSTGLPGQEAS